MIGEVVELEEVVKSFPILLEACCHADGGAEQGVRSLRDALQACLNVGYADGFRDANNYANREDVRK